MPSFLIVDTRVVQLSLSMGWFVVWLTKPMRTVMPSIYLAVLTKVSSSCILNVNNMVWAFNNGKVSVMDSFWPYS